MVEEQSEREQFDLINVGTLYQVADILTKAFNKAAKHLSDDDLRLLLAA